MSEIGENSIYEFLELHPWSREDILKKVFGKHFQRLIRAKEVRKRDILGLGTCYAIKTEKISSLPGAHRYNIARQYLLKSFGSDVFWVGGSPGLWGSDAMVYVQQRVFIRIWIDIGDVSIEALPFVNPRPEVFAVNLKDFIVTTSNERAKLMQANIETFWPRHNDVVIFSHDTGNMISVPASTYEGGRRKTRRVLHKDKVIADLKDEGKKRRQLVRRDSNVGKLFSELNNGHLEALNFIGNNPLFDSFGLAYLLTMRSGDRGADKGECAEIMNALSEKLLIEDAPPPLFGLKLSSLGLEVLSKFWGCDQDTLRRFHPWPQKKFGKKYVYSTKPLTRIKEHTRTVQRFVLGLVDNAQRLSTPMGGVDFRLETIVGMRLTFVNGGDLSWVIPDGYIHAEYWKNSWIDGHVLDNRRSVGSFTILLEVDQATNPITRLSDRIKKYRQVWRSIPGTPALVWVINGTPNRERRLLEMMRDMQVPGWTVLMERLTLNESNSWWGEHPSMIINLPYEKIAGIAPLRKIWMSTSDNNLHNLFDLTPWKAEMMQTKPIYETPGY